ncbi:hypothetical protein JCM6882_006129 [Rhodosporidiobolus microsporus]
MAAPPRPKRAPPKLDLRAFQAPPAAAQTRREYPQAIVDTHIHLWTKKQLEEGGVKWPVNGGPVQLSGPHELDNYGAVVREGVKKVGGGKNKWEGVVYVQAEAEHGDQDVDGSEGGWDASLDEVESVCAVALTNPTVKVLALVPWAPVLHGAAALSLYFTRLFALPSLIGLTSHLGYPPIRSVRYLLQDSPRGFFLKPGFIDGLKELGRRGFAFDLCLDSRNQDTGGVAALEEAMEMIEKVREGQKEGEQTVFILDHFSKPSLSDETFSHSSDRLSPFRTAYISALHALSLLPHTHLKLSGFLDFPPPGLVQQAFGEFKEGKMGGRDSGFGTLKERVLAYLEPAIEAWGVERILVGSDWPMFRPHLFPSTHTSPSSPSTTATDEAAAWAFEMQLYLSCLTSLGLEGEDLDRIFAGNAKRVYRLGRDERDGKEGQEA